VAGRTREHRRMMILVLLVLLLLGFAVLRYGPDDTLRLRC
jgi:hypothetical protein